MDFRPIPQSSTNKVNTSINLANDGGSKSNTGYMNQRGGGGENPAIEESVDEVTLSTSNTDEAEEEISKTDFEKFWDNVKQFFEKIAAFFRNKFGGNKVEIENIFEEIGLEESSEFEKEFEEKFDLGLNIEFDFDKEEADMREEDETINPKIFQEHPE